MKAKDLIEKTEAELQQNLLELRKEQFNLRMQMGMGQITTPHLFNKVRKDIARIKTVLVQKQKQAAQ